MDIKIEILPPTMPNFIQTKQPVGKRQDGPKLNQGIPVESLTRQQAEDYAELMKRTFMTHWKSKQPIPSAKKK